MESLSYCILIIIFVCVLLCYGIWLNGVFDRKGIKCIKPPIPFLGNLIYAVLTKKHCFQMMDEIYRAFPEESIVGYFEFTKPCYIVRDLNLIHEIALKDSFPNHRTFIDGESDPLFGNFLINIRGDRWKRMRSALTPVFTSNKLKGMFEFMVECGEQLVHFFEKEIQQKTNNDSEIMEIEINSALKRFTNDVISTTVFGLQNNSFTDKENEMLKYGRAAAHLNTKQAITFLIYLSFPRLMKFLRIPIYDKKIVQYFTTLVKTTLKHREDNKIFRPDMMQLLIETKMKSEKSGNVLSDYDLTAQVLFFYLGGFESTSLISAFLIYELAKHPDCQKRLQNEIDEYISTTDKLTYESINKMKYLDMALSEALRLWPTVAFVDRECVKDYTISAEYTKNNKPLTIHKNECVWLSIYSVQRDPKYFPDPEIFNPERFSDENKSSIDPRAYMPFGLGTRRCIGARYAEIVMKVGIFFLLSKFDFFVTEKTSIPYSIDSNSIVLQFKDGYWLGMKKRQSIAEYKCH